jgi:hypothetical protein
MHALHLVSVTFDSQQHQHTAQTITTSQLTNNVMTPTMMPYCFEPYVFCGSDQSITTPTFTRGTDAHHHMFLKIYSPELKLFRGFWALPDISGTLACLCFPTMSPPSIWLCEVVYST